MKQSKHAMIYAQVFQTEKTKDLEIPCAINGIFVFTHINISGCCEAFLLHERT